MARGLSHLDGKGRARMVDVGGKKATAREAVARARVLVAPRTFRLLRAGGTNKGDVLTVAEIAGVQAAKRTSGLIPLCHPLPLTFAGVRLSLNAKDHAVEIEATCRTRAKTGVEMEALTAAAVAALTVYDMCKSAERGIRIADLRLVRKSGGSRGTYEGD